MCWPDVIRRMKYALWALTAVVVAAYAQTEAPPPPPADASVSNEPLVWNYKFIIAILLTFAVSALANISGVGGGTIFVPLYALTMQGNIKESMALSQVCICAGSSITVLMGIFRRHPSNPACPLIDYRYGVLVGPAMLFGSGVGVVLQALFPSWLVTALLVLTLIPICAQTVRRVILMRRAEAGARRASRELEAAGEAELEAGDAQEVEMVREAKLGLPKQNTLDDEPAPADATASTNLGSAIIKRISAQFEPAPMGSGPLRSLPPGAPLLMEDLDDHAAQGSDLASRTSSRLARRTSRASATLDSQASERLAAEAGEGADPAARGTATPPAALTDIAEEVPPPPPKLRVPWELLGFLTAVWAVFLALQTSRTTQYTCSWAWILIFVLQSLCTIVPSVVMAHFVLRAVKRAALAAGAPGAGVEGEGAKGADASRFASEPAPTLTRWEAMLSGGATELTATQVLVAWLATLVGGVLGSMLGLGGGVVVVPLLLELGVHPQAAGLTSTLMVFFMSSATMAVYAAKGFIPGRAAGILGACSLVGAAAGVLVITEAIRRSGRASLIAVVLMCVLLAGFALTVAFPLRLAVQDMVEYGVPGFNSYCNRAGG